MSFQTSLSRVRQTRALFITCCTGCATEQVYYVPQHISLCNTEYYGKGVCKYVLLRCICDILNAMLHFAFEKACNDAYVWARPVGCRMRSAACGFHGNWEPRDARWWRFYRSRCCPSEPRRVWWRSGRGLGRRRPPGRANHGQWTQSPWWCWAPRTAAASERCPAVGTERVALGGDRKCTKSGMY